MPVLSQEIDGPHEDDEKSVAIVTRTFPTPKSVMLVTFQLAASVGVPPVTVMYAKNFGIAGCQFIDSGVTATAVVVADSICACDAPDSPLAVAQLVIPVPSVCNSCDTVPVTEGSVIV